MKPNEASHIVISAAIKVHMALGAGILENAYDACMFYELTITGLHFEHHVHLPVVYNEIRLPNGVSRRLHRRKLPDR